MAYDTSDATSGAKIGWRENIALFGALAANFGIAVAKFVAFTASSSMLT